MRLQIEHMLWDHMESVIAAEVNTYQLHDSEVNGNQAQVTALIPLCTIVYCMD